MVAPAPLVERFDTAKQTSDLMSGTLDQHIILEAVKRGVPERIAPQLRALYRSKRDVMEQALRAQLGDRLTWLAPKGGFFLWATLPDGLDDVSLLERAVENKLVFVTGSAFFVDGTGHDTIRLSFSAPTPERIVEGVRRLSAAMQPAAALAAGRAPAAR